MEPSLPTRAEDKGHGKDGKVERNGNQAGCLNGSQVTGVQKRMSAWPSINSCRSGKVKAVHDENRRDGSVVNSMNKGSQLGTEWKVPKGSPPGSQKARELLKASVRRRHVAKEPTRAPQALPNAQLQTAIHSLVHQRPGPGTDVPQGQSAEGIEAVRDCTEAGCAHRQLQETRRFADSDGRPEEEDTHREPQEGRKLGDAHKVPGNSQGRVGEERRPPQSGLGAPDRNGDKCSGCEMRRSTDTVGDPKDKSCPGCSVCPQEGEAQTGIASLGKRKWAAMLAVKKSLAVKQWPLQEVTLTAYQPPKQPCSVDASKSLDSVEEDRKRKLGHLKALLRGKTKLQASVQVGGVQLPDSGARLAAHIDELREGIKELGGDPDDIFDDAVTKKGFAPAQRNSNTHAITPLVVSSLPEPSPRNFDSRHADGQEPHSKPGDTDGKEAKAGAWGGKGWTFEDEEGRVQGPFTADQLKMLKDHDLVTDSTVCSHPLMGALALLKVLGGSLNDGNSCTPDCDQCSVAPAVSSAGSLSKDGPLDPKLSHEGAGEGFEGESSSGSILNHRDGQGACPDSAPEGLIFYPCSQVQEIDPEGNVDVVTGNAGTPAPGECVGQSHCGGVGQLDRPDVDSQAEMLPAPPDHPTGFFPIAAGTQQDLQTCGNVGMPVCWDGQLVSSKQASAQQPFDTSLTCQRSLHRAEVQEALDCTAAQVDLGGDELVQDDRCRGVTSITGMSHQSCAVGSAHYASQIGQAASPAFSLQSAAGAAPGRVGLLRDSELNGSFANQGATLHLAASMNSPLSNGLVSGSFTGQGAALLACNQPIRMESGSSMNELEDAEIWQFVNHLGATEGPVSLRRLRCKFQSGLVSVNTICHDEDEGTSVTLGRLMAGLPDFVVQARLRKLRHSSQGMAANALPLAQPVGCMRHSPLSHPVPRTFEDSGASSKTLAVDSRLPMGLIYPEAPSSALQTGCYQLQTAPQAAQASRLFMQQQPMAAPVNGAGCTAGSKWPTGAFAAGGVAIQGHANPAFIPSPIAQAVEGGILQMRPNVPPPVGLQFAYQIPPSGTYFTRR
ncbi:unnamed protein product [Ostreobium quekettii]|uniref:Uncharacterized protein n=1 Tax=Ostreobium quekettii TaxID=121088 RepID=A0A8S1JFY7_9CHLO|nr:unnamed protein product [Ostreobium quekettii]